MENAGTNNAVILFTRFPKPGKVKTRLIKALGSQGAADFHASMTRKIVNHITPALHSLNINLTIFFTGGTALQMQQWLGQNLQLYPQQGNNLGQRMEHALTQTGKRGARRILLIGSDCPGTNTSIINAGFSRLHHHDLVLGPAHDGGYYLVGCRMNGTTAAAIHGIFQNIPWGTATVLKKTVRRAEHYGLSHALLPILHDIDRPEDLVHINYHTCS